MNKTRIAKNLNKYIMKKVPEHFWDEWRQNKDELKSKGFAPFKRRGEFFLAIYNGDVATELEYKQQEAEYIQEVRAELLTYINENKKRFSDLDFNNIHYILCNKKTLEEFGEIKKYIYDYDLILMDIEDFLFKEMITQE